MCHDGGLLSAGEAGDQGLVSWSPALRFCGSALHHGLVNVAVVDLSSDALAAELTRDLLSHGDAPVTTAPAGHVHPSEDGLYLHGVHCDESADPVDAERDDTVRSRRRQDVVTDHRIQTVPVAQLRVMVR